MEAREGGGGGGDASAAAAKATRLTPEELERYKREKVPVQPGFSAMHWVQYTQRVSTPELHTITAEEVARHATFKDAWTILHGNVYDLSAYMRYHPGGMKTLMLAAGIDASEMFEQIHAWVNYEFLLQKFRLGSLAKTS